MVTKLKVYNEYSESDRQAIDALLQALNNLPEGFKIEAERDILTDQEIIDGLKDDSSTVRVVEHIYGSYKCEPIASVRKNIVF